MTVLVADPPWKFGDKLPGGGRGAEKHYPCMSIADLERFHIPDVGSDAILFMWKVASMPDEAVRLVKAWGFVPKSELVWLKRTTTGKRHFGMGRYVRAEHETCVIATRGRYKVKSASVRSTFEAPVGRHSAKPDRFYEIVEELCDGPYYELFARRVRPGWTCLGNEVEAA